MIYVEVGTMPWDVVTVPGVTSSEGTVETVEWRARQENRGKRRFKPQRHPSAETPPAHPASPAQASPHPDEDPEHPHRLNVLA